MKQAVGLNEMEIIDQILKGNSALYEMIVRQYNPYLYKVGRSYNYNHEDTEDLMQDTFVDAYKSLAQFQGRASFKTWIIRIMLNNCFRRKEKASFKNEIMKEVRENSQPMFTYAQNDAHKIVQNRELGSVIEKALEQIPFAYRMVFSLREINGFNVAETAHLLDVSEANVKVRLNRAKHMLRSEIEKAYSARELYEFNLIYCNVIVTNVMNRIKDL